MTMSPLPVALAPAVTPGALTPPARADTCYFLLLSPILGSDAVPGFEGQVPVLTWGWGVDATGTVLVGTGAATGKATPQEVIVRAESGTHSPHVLAAVNAGTRLDRAVLSCVRPGDRPFTFLTLTFEDVLLSGYYVTPDDADGTLLDQIRFKFAQVTQRVVIQNPDGSTGQPVTTSFDYRTGSLV